ncbi:MAG: hypothetical protein IJD01_05045 [Clostridia bacterium]|nr:hypothetical protein [Clostridia bacterium]
MKKLSASAAGTYAVRNIDADVFMPMQLGGGRKADQDRPSFLMRCGIQYTKRTGGCGASF